MTEQQEQKAMELCKQYAFNPEYFTNTLGMYGVKCRGCGKVYTVRKFYLVPNHKCKEVSQ